MSPLRDDRGPRESGARLSPLDAPRASGSRPALATFGALLVHGAIIALAAGLGSGVVNGRRPLATELIEIELPVREEPPNAPEAEPTPPDPPPSAPASPTPLPKPAPTVSRPSPPAEPTPAPPPEESPPPAAAEAGQVLTAADEIVDFGDTIVTGSGASYAGGVTERGGTSKSAVRDIRARAGGVEGGTGTKVQAPGGFNRSAPPQLAGGASWDCPFPREADYARIDEAKVLLRVEVAADGRVVGVEVKRDPGDGFGREARQCAMRKRWAAGRDRDGNPIQSSALIQVSFRR